MQLNRARFLNFRNISFCDIDFSGQSHYLVGSNGQGKSNCLEAVGFITALRSFRSQSIKALFKKGEKEFRLMYHLYHEKLGDIELELSISHNKKSIKIDGANISKMGEYIGLFPVVPMHSADLTILKGAPADRRRFIDMTLSAIDRSYFSSLRLYHKALLERNKILKIPSKTNLLEAFEIELSKYAYDLIRKRLSGISRISKIVKNNYSFFTEGKETPTLLYKENIKFNTINDYRTFYKENRHKDLALGATLGGPHKDDYLFSLDVGGFKDYGSDGQQRGFCLALKLAQAELFKKDLKINPILLVDDILGELDDKRRNGFWSACSDDYQIIASGTKLEEKNEIRNWTNWDVNEAKYSKINFQ